MAEMAEVRVEVEAFEGDTVICQRAHRGESDYEPVPNWNKRMDEFVGTPLIIIDMLAMSNGRVRYHCKKSDEISSDAWWFDSTWVAPCDQKNQLEMSSSLKKYLKEMI